MTSTITLASRLALLFPGVVLSCHIHVTFEHSDQENASSMKCFGVKNGWGHYLSTCCAAFVMVITQVPLSPSPLAPTKPASE